jgi:hypothetical protein
VGAVVPRVRHHSAFGMAGPRKIEWVFGSTIRTTVLGGMLISEMNEFRALNSMLRAHVSESVRSPMALGS